jgi:hypothetical protein
MRSNLIAPKKEVNRGNGFSRIFIPNYGYLETGVLSFFCGGNQRVIDINKIRHISSKNIRLNFTYNLSFPSHEKSAV